MDASRFLQRSSGRVHPISDTSHSEQGSAAQAEGSLQHPGCTSQVMLSVLPSFAFPPPALRMCREGSGVWTCVQFPTLRESGLTRLSHAPPDKAENGTTFPASFPSGLPKDLRTFIKHGTDQMSFAHFLPPLSQNAHHDHTKSATPLSQRASELLIIAMGNPTLIYTN